MAKRKATIRDVARAANVSPSAVSLVLKDKPGVSVETRQRVRNAIAKLGYTAVNGTRNGRSRAVGLLIEKYSMPVLLDIFYGDIMRGFQTEAQRMGYQVLLHMFDRTVENLDGLRSSLTDQIQGLIVANDGDITPQMVIQLESMTLPIVLIENHIPGQQLPSILGDNFTAGYTVTQHLLSLGHRKIGVLPGPKKYSSLVDRLKGILAGAAEAGILIPREWQPLPTSGHPQKGYVQMQEILRLAHRPTAIVAISDKTAFGAMEAIKEAGLRIPEDIAIASIDNVADSAFGRPPLTTYRIPRYEMGVLAMQKLHRAIVGEPEIPVKSIVYGELIVRESSRAGVAT